MLQSRTSLLIHSKWNGLHLLTPNSILLPPFGNHKSVLYVCEAKTLILIGQFCIDLKHPMDKYWGSQSPLVLIFEDFMGSDFRLKCPNTAETAACITALWALAWYWSGPPGFAQCWAADLVRTRRKQQTGHQLSCALEFSVSPCDPFFSHRGQCGRNSLKPH